MGLFVVLVVSCLYSVIHLCTSLVVALSHPLPHLYGSFNFQNVTLLSLNATGEADITEDRPQCAEFMYDAYNLNKKNKKNKKQHNY